MIGDFENAIRSVGVRRGYAVAVVAVAIATVARLAIAPLVGEYIPFATLFPAVLAASWIGGLGPGVASVALGFVVSIIWLFPVETAPIEYWSSMIVFTTVGSGIALLGGRTRDAIQRWKETADRAVTSEDELRTTFASIGDAVIVTDVQGRITSLNAVASELTGWPIDEAIGRRLEDVFVIVDERTRRPVESPAERVLRDGRIVGLANHTILISRDGVDRPIDDSAAPVRSARRELFGVVLVFRDVAERRRTENLSRHLAAIVESSSDAIVSADEQGRIASWNPGAERIFGYRANEVLGKSLSLLTPTDLNDELSSRLESRERIDDFETTRLRKDGGRVDVSVSCSPLRDGSGDSLGTAIVMRDITERKRVERALADEARINETIHRIGLAIAAQFDLQTVVQTVTDEATRLVEAKFGAFFYNVHDLNGGSYMLYTIAGVPREMFERFPMPRNTAIFEPTFRGEGVMRLDDVLADPRYGRNAPYRGMPEGHLPVRSYLSAPVVSRSGEVLGGLFFGHPDVGVFTERHEQLVRGVAIQAGIAIENARLYQEVRDADRRKDEFLAILGHELRNPLAPITNALHLLRMPNLAPAASEQARSILERQVQHMARLVDDLLDVSRIVRGKIELRREPIDVAAVVRRSVELAQSVIDAEGHRLELDLPSEPAMVHCDQIRLAQIVNNLITNAVRYTERGGLIRVSVRVKDGSAIIAVADNGIGIAADALPKIWDMFVQADRRLKRSHGGMGIGLTLVRSLVGLHGGSVAAASDGLGKGSVFTVTLPLITSLRPGNAIDRPQAAGPIVPRRVLIVDDNVDSAESLALLLRMEGHSATVAHDGATAIELARSNPPEIAFLDIGMPGIDGCEVARRLRGINALRDVVLVAMTGWGQDDDRRRTREAGFDAHEVKPVDVDVIRDLLKNGRPRKGKG